METSVELESDTRNTIHRVVDMIIAQDMVRESAAERTKRIQAQRKERRGLTAHSSHIQQGDIVYIHVPRLLQKESCKKLQQVYMGPYIVCKFHSKHSVVLRNLQSNQIVSRAIHVDRLKKVQNVRNNSLTGRLIQPQDDV